MATQVFPVSLDYVVQYLESSISNPLSLREKVLALIGEINLSQTIVSRYRFENGDSLVSALKSGDPHE